MHYLNPSIDRASMSYEQHYLFDCFVVSYLIPETTKSSPLEILNSGSQLTLSNNKSNPKNFNLIQAF